MGFWLSHVLSVTLSKAKRGARTFPPERRHSSATSLKEKGSEVTPKLASFGSRPAQSPLTGGTDHLSYVQGGNGIGIHQLTSSVLPSSWQMAMGFQTACKPKISFHVSCKTVGEKLAYSSFLSLSLSTTPFLLKINK